MANTIPHSAVARAKRQRAAVERVLIEAGTEGLPVLEVVARLADRHPVSTVLKWLAELAAEGRAERNNNGGPACRWGPPGTRDAWKARRKHADRLKAKRDRDAEKHRKQREKQTAEVLSKFDEPFVHRVVPAAGQPMPVTRAVRSVFEVAA